MSCYFRNCALFLGSPVHSNVLSFSSQPPLLMIYILSFLENIQGHVIARKIINFLIKLSLLCKTQKKFQKLANLFPFYQCWHGIWFLSYSYKAQTCLVGWQVAFSIACRPPALDGDQGCPLVQGYAHCLFYLKVAVLYILLQKYTLS